MHSSESQEDRELFNAQASKWHKLCSAWITSDHPIELLATCHSEIRNHRISKKKHSIIGHSSNELGMHIPIFSFRFDEVKLIKTLLMYMHNQDISTGHYFSNTCIKDFVNVYKPEWFHDAPTSTPHVRRRTEQTDIFSRQSVITSVDQRWKNPIWLNFHRCRKRALVLHVKIPVSPN